MPDPWISEFPALTSPYLSSVVIPPATNVVFEIIPSGFFAVTTGTITGTMKDGTAVTALPVIAGYEYRIRLASLTSASTASVMLTGHLQAQRAVTPSILPMADSILPSQAITITDSTPGAAIRYTLDGSAPTIVSILYTAPFNLGLGEAQQVRAIGVSTGYLNSLIASKTYNVRATQVVLPVIVPAAGQVLSNDPISISTTTPGATIRYTTDGSVPTATSTPYIVPFTLLPGAVTVRAIAFSPTMADSAMASTAYTVLNVNAVVAALLAEAVIPTRDGVLTVTSTATVDPDTGAVVPANTANGRNVNVNGTVLVGAAVRADRATSGLFGAATSSNALASNTAAVGIRPSDRTLVEDTANAPHMAMAGTASLTDGVNYTVSLEVRRGVGARNLSVYLDAVGTNRAGFTINLTDGTQTALTAGNGVLTRSSSRQLSNGNWLVQGVVSSAAWGAAATLSYRLNNSPAGFSSYLGDGVSSVIISGYQCELGDSASMPLNWDGGAASRVATLNSWNQALGVTAGSMFNLSMPYSRAGTVAFSTAPTMYDANALGLFVYGIAGQSYYSERTDTLVNNRNVTSASSPAVSGQQQAATHRWDAVSNRITVNGVTVSSATPTLPFLAATPIIIGNRVAIDRPYEGWDFNMNFLTRAISDLEVRALVSTSYIVVP